jgi:DNA-binding transcriptional regulator YiaG
MGWIAFSACWSMAGYVDAGKMFLKRLMKSRGDKMTPAKFKEHRYDLALTQEELGHILNVNGRTIRKWETDDGTRPVNPIAIRVMEWMMAGYRPPEFPQD